LVIVSKRRRPQSHATSAGTKPAEREKVRDIFVVRPFQGLKDEADWVAMRELVPAATAPLRLSEKLTADFGERDIMLATVLPLAWPGLVKPDGRIFLGLQRGTQSGDVSRDIALSLQLALEAAPGGPVSPPPLPGPGPRLQDLLADDGLAITVRDGFEFWLDEESTDPEVKASLERANGSTFPTTKLAAAPAAYWCRFPEKAHVRWVLAEEEDSALAALSRLARAGALTLGPTTRFAGMFRAHGLLVPVWDLPPEPDAQEWEEPVAAFAQRYATARAAGLTLDADERRARQGLVGRQITLR
jgi:Family of unknown function (DUF5926)